MQTLDYSLLVFLHVACLVYWVGADLAVFYGAGIAARPSVGPDAREAIGTLTRWVDQFPRSAVPLILLTGTLLAHRAGYLDVATAWVALACLASIAWISLNIVLYRRHVAGEQLTPWSTADLVLRSAVMVVVITAGVAALSGVWAGTTGWVGLKLLLFGAAIAFSLAVRHLFKPFRPALARVVAGDASECDLETMRSALARTRVAVVGIWLCAAAAAFTGIAKSM
jgi:hypothetical protein